jgi:RHS repeat-associated protein
MMAACIFMYGQRETTVEQINNSTGEVLYLHHDQQGSTRLLTSSTGVKEATFTYGPYGGVTGSTGIATTPLGYDAQYTSADTGLIYLRAREYDPATAQFLIRDPLAAITGEPYSYAGDNPLNESDPTGRGILEVIISGCADEPASCAALGAAAGTAGVIAGRQTSEEVISAMTSGEGTHENDEGEAELKKNEEERESGCGTERNPAQDKKLSPGQIEKLKKAGFDPHELKLGAGEDLYTDSEGNIYAKPQGGAGPGEPIGINIKNLLP